MSTVSILDHTAKVLDERQDQYGDPCELLGDIARRWSITTGERITRQQVVLCMIDLKLARLAYNPGHIDSIVDVIGYRRRQGAGNGCFCGQHYLSGHQRELPDRSGDAHDQQRLRGHQPLLHRCPSADEPARSACGANRCGRAEHVRELVEALTSGTAPIPDLARQTLLLVADMIEGLSRQIRAIEVELLAWHRANAACRRLETIPGIGFITATALAATVGDARVFSSGRQFAAWLGLVPKQHSSGGKERMGGISKMGDRYLRHLLVVGATAVIRYTRRKATTVSAWANRLLERKPARLVSVAVANKMARIAWAVMTREENYRAAPAIA